jgi:geranylgeranyl pyrophosphate synthase
MPGKSAREPAEQQSRAQSEHVTGEAAGTSNLATVCISVLCSKRSTPLPANVPSRYVMRGANRLLVLCSSVGVREARALLHLGVSANELCHPAGKGCMHASQSRHFLTGIVGPLMSAATREDPFSLVKPELRCVAHRIKQAVTSEVPKLHEAASYFFQSRAEGKQIRPVLCLLVSSALSAASPPNDHTSTVDHRPVATVPMELRRRQQRVAEIVELIHVASLLHDDVLDDATTRRGKCALNQVLGNKVAILAGDFMLARASMTLASLQDADVVTLMSQVLEDLVSGELLQATAAPQSLTSMEYCLRKTYLKTASLMAHACEAVAVLSHAQPSVRQSAHDLGKNLGLAFQASFLT